MLEQYKTHYFKQRKDNKAPNSNWVNTYRHIEKTFLKYKNKCISLKIIKEIIEEHTKNDSLTRKRHLNGLAALLKYFDNDNFKKIIKQYKSENNPKSKTKYIPTDAEIVKVYHTGFEINPKCAKKWRYRYAQWQFLYSLLAIYGLRVHEAWNIKNWDKPVYLKAGDYIAIPDDENSRDENEKGKYSYRIVKKNDIIYPLLDTVNNPHHILCIGHNTKTGYREAFPISPSGAGKDCDWIEDFNLLQPMNLPDIEKPLEAYPKYDYKRCTAATSSWFQEGRSAKSKYGFSPHALRHAYNIRGHNLGVNQKTLANSLGHGIQMNSWNYMKHEQASSKREGMHMELDRQSNKKTELEKALERTAYLEDENKHLKTEIEKLKTELAMYKAIEQSKPN